MLQIFNVLQKCRNWQSRPKHSVRCMSLWDKQLQFYCDTGTNIAHISMVIKKIDLDIEKTVIQIGKMKNSVLALSLLSCPTVSVSVSVSNAMKRKKGNFA
jgi:hypothetical protein